jgi:hypothetical protein
MNGGTNAHRNDGIDVLWPTTSSCHFDNVLVEAGEADRLYNISPVIQDTVNGEAAILWMGGLETDFMDSISDAITLCHAEIPEEELPEIDPRVVLVSEAPSEDLHYYPSARSKQSVAFVPPNPKLLESAYWTSLRRAVCGT